MGKQRRERYVHRNGLRIWLIGSVVSAVAVASFAGLGASSVSATTKKSHTPISLGIITSVSTAIANYPGSVAGAQAAAKAINKEGGINGHPLKIIFCNDEFTASDAATCADNLVTDKVSALVGSLSSSADLQVLSILQPHKIPDIGFIATGNAPEWTSASAWPLTTGEVGPYLAMPAADRQLGIQSLVFVRLALPNEPAITAGVRQVDTAEHDNVTIDPDIVVPVSGVSDYTPYAEQVQESGAKSVAFIGSPSEIIGVVQAMQSLGVSAQLLMNPYAENEETLGAMPADLVNGTVLPAPFPTFRSTSVKGIRTYDSEMNADGVPNTSLMRGLDAENAWLAVHAFAIVADKIKGTVNGPSESKQLSKTGVFNDEGLLTVDPIAQAKGSSFFGRFPDSGPWVYLQFENGAFVPDPALTPNDPLPSVR